jgi:IS1 family transposase
MARVIAQSSGFQHGNLEPNQMTRFVRLLPFLLLLAKFSYAQTDAVRVLQDALKDRQLWLRNYSADRTARYEWANGTLVDKPSRLHALSIFIPRSIKYEHDKLVLEGDRATVVRDIKQNKVFFAGKVPMTLEVDLQNAAPDIVIPQNRRNYSFRIDRLQKLTCLNPMRTCCLSMSAECQSLRGLCRFS